MDLETAARKRREKQRGAEKVHSSGLAIVRRAEDRRHVERLAERMARWAKEPSIEAQVERNRHVPLPDAKNKETRAQREAHMRAILDACED